MEQQDEARIARLLTEQLRWGPPKGWPPILGNCWSAPRLSPELIDSKLAGLYPFRWHLAVYVAGKQAAPEGASFALASRVLSELPKHIATIPELDQWMLSAVAFPYQRDRALWYADMESEYGSILDYAFMRSTSDEDFSISDYGRGSYESVPGTIIRALDLLRHYKVTDQELVHLTERIETEKLFGTELICPLLKILERNSTQFAPPIWSDIKERFDAIAKFAD